MNYYTLLFAFLNTIIGIIYIVDSLKAQKRSALAPIFASIIFGAGLIYLLRELGNETAIFFTLSFAALFSVLPFYYAVKNRKLITFLLITIVEFFYATLTYGSLLYPFIQMFAVGTAFGIYYKLGSGAFANKRGILSKSIETNRDVVHLLGGLLILGIFLLVPFYYATLATFSMILIGYVYNSIIGKAKKGTFFSTLNTLERPNAMFGLGALYIGVGTAALLGFIHNLHFLVIGIIALFFADPIATIVGINTKGPRLFYNKGKSLYGSIAFLTIVSIFGYFFIGVYSVAFGLALAIIESIRSPVDDNVSIPAAMVIAYIIFLAYLHQLPF